MDSLFPQKGSLVGLCFTCLDKLHKSRKTYDAAPCVHRSQLNYGSRINPSIIRVSEPAELQTPASQASIIPLLHLFHLLPSSITSALPWHPARLSLTPSSSFDLPTSAPSPSASSATHTRAPPLSCTKPLAFKLNKHLDA